MRTLIVYESMYANTHVTADRIADGLRPSGPVDVAPVHEATGELLASADLWPWLARTANPYRFTGSLRPRRWRFRW